MTLEYAAELVNALRQHDRLTQGNHAIELFTHFVEYFGLEGTNQILFARLCGYIATVESECE